MLKEIDVSKVQEYKFAIIKTEKGDIKLKLFGEEAPQTVCNFANLANDGFYKNLTFHRVIPNFVIQGGCPYGTGTGGPGYEIACECDGQKHKHLRGTLSMAHAGRDTGGSQFFITHSPQSHLDGVHTVFGQIDRKDEESFKTLDSIKAGDKILDIIILSEEKSETKKEDS
ncbi:peptidylprolyl isomerase [Campylobacter sp. LR291e]|uniref:peptidylprolyl isomerase n=1 Tax=unclassified Campylobacter TaxID=2593542 RepID=UPI001237C54D|nr:MULTISPECIES: peptidylprolyl isomerase [unclassified Campylobacter]KAA6224890.1 peptidylprolyl isomerase [Campylobacter sp. LR185c]KAA6230254.1 peptidylprolyl isomerase [Campylobacter sp. LR291e]KAA6233775.1 peptidylprolyl isomerase [Campylobacter sp. LR264d]KAA8604211.1 peptidylprolyl isomerase [Campylobacter sp. LR185c]